MVVKPIIKSISGTDGYVLAKCLPSVVADLKYTGLAVPDIDRILYNLGEKQIWKLDPQTKQPVLDENGKKILERSYKTLTTVVYWATGEKTVVTNSEHDGLILNEDGTVATYSKEVGLAFAVLKRILAGRYEYDENGEEYIEDSGFGNILNQYVSAAYDCQAEALKNKEKKDAAKKRFAEEKAAAAARPKNPSLAESVRSLKSTIDDLQKLVASHMAEVK